MSLIHIMQLSTNDELFSEHVAGKSLRESVGIICKLMSVKTLSGIMTLGVINKFYVT